MTGNTRGPFSLKNQSQNIMSQISKRQRFSAINLTLVSCTWCFFWLVLCLSINTSSAQNNDIFTRLHSPQLGNENLYGLSPEFVTEETTSRLSARKKVDLIRYYLSQKIPDEKVAVVVDTAETFFDNIKRLWKLVAIGDRFEDGIMLFVYNDTDCSLVPSLKDANRTVAEILDGISASTPMSSSAASILECVNLAMQMIASDSSVMLFTGRKAGDGMALGENTGKEMINKRKEFNCIWCSTERGNLSEVDRYERIARNTNGHFLQFTKVEQDELVGDGIDPDHEYRAEKSTRSSEFSPDVEKTLPEVKIPEDETADLLYDPRISGYPEQTDSTSFENSAMIVTGEKDSVGRGALELEDMQRSAALTAIESATRLERTMVEVTAASSLVGTPGSVSRLTFTVTNNYPVTIRHYFQGRSTSFNIVYLEPRNAWIEAGQSLNVVADVLVPTTATSSTIGTVTLVVQSIGSIEKSANIYVRGTGSTISDTSKPAISYSFNNNCASKLDSGTCANSLWSVDVDVQDSDSGLQRVTSTPNGIQATGTFVSGTKSSTKFQYAATCCQTSVVILAEDLLGNSNSLTIDVTIWWNLSQGEIISIVLGTLLLLILLIIIILAIVLWILRRKKSQDLPFTQRYGSRPRPTRAERTSF